MSNPDFKVELPQEVYQPVSFPVVVQRALDLVTYPLQPTVYPQNWYQNGYFGNSGYSGSTGFVGPQNLSMVLTASQAMKKTEHRFDDYTFSGN